MPEFSTTALDALMTRLQKGDQAAADELVRNVGVRLEWLARKMLRRYPSVSRWEDANDVVQNAVLRLLRALKAVRPQTTREFFGLAAEQVRRELIDLARHFQGAHGWGRRHAKSLDENVDSGDGQAFEPADEPVDGESHLERWTNLHEAAAQMPTMEREVFGLVFYHGWKQQDIAQVLAVDERTVRRRWTNALRLLKDSLGSDIPESD